MKRETNMSILDLITQVEQKPCLYHTEHQWYRDPEKTYSVWGAIGAAMGFSGEDCKSKWKITRDTYVKKKRQLKTRNGKAARRTAKWPYLRFMSFLDPFLQERESVSDLYGGNSCSSSDRSEEDEDGDAEFGEVLDHPEELDKAVAVKQENESEPVHTLRPRDMTTLYLPTVKESRKRKEGDCVGQVMLGFLSSKKQKQQMRRMVQEEEEEEEEEENEDEEDAKIRRRPLPSQLDEDKLFLMSQLPTLRRLPAAKKAAAKLKIHEILFHAEHGTPETQ